MSEWIGNEGGSNAIALGSNTIGQTFTAYKSWNQIDVLLYAASASSIWIDIYNGKTGSVGSPIQTIDYPVASGATWRVVPTNTFPAGDYQYRMRIKSGAVTVYRSADNVYPDGAEVYNGTLSTRDHRFRVWYVYTPTEGTWVGNELYEYSYPLSGTGYMGQVFTMDNPLTQLDLFFSKTTVTGPIQVTLHSGVGVDAPLLESFNFTSDWAVNTNFWKQLVLSQSYPAGTYQFRASSATTGVGLWRKNSDVLPNSNVITDVYGAGTYTDILTLDQTFRAWYVDTPTGPQPKRWNGTEWVNATVKRWNGTAWVPATLKRY